MDQVKKRKNRNEIRVYNRRIDRKIQAGLERLVAAGIAKELPKYDQRCKSAIFHLQHDDHKNLKQINLEIILA